jgi:hypothetical protein
MWKVLNGSLLNCFSFTSWITSETQLFHSATLLCIAAIGLLVAAFFHSRSICLVRGSLAVASWQALVNHHLATMLSMASGWFGHVVHVAIPASRGVHVDGLAILTFIGGLLLISDSLYLTDLSAVANGIDFNAGLFPESLHYQLALNLAACGTASSYAAQHIDALPAYACLDKVSHAGDPSIMLSQTGNGLAPIDVCKPWMAGRCQATVVVSRSFISWVVIWSPIMEFSTLWLWI